MVVKRAEAFRSQLFFLSEVHIDVNQDPTNRRKLKYNTIAAGLTCAKKKQKAGIREMLKGYKKSFTDGAMCHSEFRLPINRVH